uniref:Uncharacterized protein n=1 Tax=Palpitomonas bilix TaxID=652834 RepID=A0A7S3G695_9EUKA
MIPQLHSRTWSSILTVVISVGYIYTYMGLSVFLGMAVMLVAMPLSAMMGRIVKNATMAAMKKKDTRVDLMNEYLQHVKAIRLYVWESAILKRIKEARLDEVRLLRKSKAFFLANSAMWSQFPTLVSLAAFGSFAVFSKTGISAEVIFPVLSLFGFMQGPMTLISKFHISIISSNVCLKRIESFLKSSELPPKEHLTLADSEAVVFENAVFSWNDQAKPLHVNDLVIPKGKLVAVVGKVGSGKSSLLSSILGEMKTVSGRVVSSGSIAYVPQEAWILNSTFRQNIVFHADENEEKLERVLINCSLTEDIESLPAGDMTEIGDRGVTLSGGQKQRISLARAAYSDSDIILLDDTLSAVDARVGSNLFEDVLSASGILAKKTRILATHNLSVLGECDMVILMDENRVLEYGEYDDLLAQQGKFCQLMSAHFAMQEDGKHGRGKTFMHLTRSLTNFSRMISQRDLDARHPVPPAKDQSRAEVPQTQKSITNEKAETGSVRLTTIRAYIRAVGVGSTIFSILLMLAMDGFSARADYWLAKWGASANASSNESDAVHGIDLSVSSYLYAYSLLAAAKAISMLLYLVVFFSAALAGARILHDDMLRSVTSASMSFFDTTPIGRVINTFSKDVDALDDTLPIFINEYLSSLSSVLSIIALVVWANPQFVVIFLLVGAVFYYVQRVYRQAQIDLHRLDRVVSSSAYAYFSQTLNGVSSIRAYACEEKFELEYANRLDMGKRVQIALALATRWLKLRLALCTAAIIAAIGFLAVMPVGNTLESIALSGLALSTTMKISSTLSRIVKGWSVVESSMTSVERVLEYTRIPNGGCLTVPEKKTNATWPSRGRIDFKDVSMRYREALPLALKKVNFHIRAGEKVGIVGRTGAGKSSLMTLLSRFVEPCEGSIIIDDVDIKDIGLIDLWSAMSVIPQDPIIFSGSIRFNLDPEGSKSEVQLQQAIQQVGLKDTVEKLGGLDYEISEGSRTMSVGEKQLFSLARALLKNSKVSQVLCVTIGS